ncbi:MAG: hypothetical protein LKJ21_05160 [Oscillospiraceae bacterium]|jgi:predicted membrane protein|nr:hypothetical protein [Oscillospiraceae bacterium]MCI1990175.1 hypothetical protein [Oscillospiraceae bacterium]MCI2034868.1 hypothetical protein [Oscillospiraceae bacterium]
MKHRNWFWGIFFLAAALFIVVGQTTQFLAVGFWSVAATVLLAAVILSSLPDGNFFGIFVPAALLYLIYRAPLHWPAISPWLLLLAAVLASLGCGMIFHGGRWHHHHGEGGWHGEGNPFSRSEENVEGNDVFVKSSFSESCKYLHSDCLKNARLVSSFGKMSVYFDQVRLSPDGAEAQVESSFGEMVLYLPKAWQVVDRVRAGFGAVNNDVREASPAADAPKLTLTGSVSFGNLEIRYI